MLVDIPEDQNVAELLTAFRRGGIYLSLGSKHTGAAATLRIDDRKPPRVEATCDKCGGRAVIMTRATTGESPDPWNRPLCAECFLDEERAQRGVRDNPAPDTL